MRATTALVWTFYDGINTAQLKVWKEGSVPGKVLMVIDKAIPRGKDGYTKVPLTGLNGGQWYSYAFFSGKERSVVGRFRTAFAPGVLAPLTIGATTCTKNTLAPFESLQKLAKERIDCILHMGDMSYNDGAKTVAEYRKVWRKQLQAGGYKELLPRAGMYITWDDHEITNNFDPEKLDKKHLAAGKNAFFETLPVERGPNDRLWNSYLWGNTAEIILLDSRSERKPSTRKSNDPIYLGKAQMKWVKERLKKSPAHFKLLMNSVPMTNMPAIWLSSSDRWEGFKKQREELLNHITDNNIKGVWFLSGDFHVGFVSKLEEKGKWSKLREVAVGPGDSYPNPLGVVGLPKKQFDFGSSYTKVMTTLTFDPKANEVRIRFVRDNGVILYDAILNSA
jgi:alkaline phosphatase D